jgi:hypothetical protein
MLAEWNEALERLDATLAARPPGQPLDTYGEDLLPEDRAPIPERDMPEGAPPWMRSLSTWATRKGDTAEAKRATVVVTVPKDERPWDTLGP